MERQMKVQAHRLMAVLIAALMITVAGSCSKDDDAGEQGADLVGTWVSDAGSGWKTSEITFRAGGKGTLKAGDFMNLNFDYTVSGSTISYAYHYTLLSGDKVVQDVDDKGSWEYRLDGGALYIDGQRFRRKE